MKYNWPKQFKMKDGGRALWECFDKRLLSKKKGDVSKNNSLEKHEGICKQRCGTEYKEAN